LLVRLLCSNCACVVEREPGAMVVWNLVDGTTISKNATAL